MEATTQHGHHGPALMAFLDAEFRTLGLKPTTWARAHGITPGSLAKWREGRAEPELGMLERIAIALGRPTLDLFIAAEYVQPADTAHTLNYTSPYDVDAAIENDPRLVEVEQDILRAARKMGLAARAGNIPPAEKIKRP